MPSTKFKKMLNRAIKLHVQEIIDCRQLKHYFEVCEIMSKYFKIYKLKVKFINHG